MFRCLTDVTLGSVKYNLLEYLKLVSNCSGHMENQILTSLILRVTQKPNLEHFHNTRIYLGDKQSHRYFFYYLRP